MTPTEFWLWWITDEFGERRKTTYRMSRQVALVIQAGFLSRLAYPLFKGVGDFLPCRSD